MGGAIKQPSKSNVPGIFQSRSFRLATAISVGLLLAGSVLLLQFSARAAGTVYYIDDTLGNDSSNGTSPTTAWKTLAKVNAGTTFAPEDQILLKRGGVWRETLNVPASGLSGLPILFGAYGSIGTVPRITGADHTHART